MLNIGDTIQCTGTEDMVNTMMALATEGIQTDFLFEKDGKTGYWIEVVDMDEVSDCEEISDKEVTV